MVCSELINIRIVRNKQYRLMYYLFYRNRVSLTYRVKSAHKVKLTDKQLLQWMVPILLVMLIYLGTWTLSDTPTAEEIMDNEELRFKQCTYNWWDHSLAIGKFRIRNFSAFSKVESEKQKKVWAALDWNNFQTLTCLICLIYR